ncbi:PREDICTED: translation initiation factor IF-2-like [Capra hircus]|uniref:translation initiation factor IF-2-like n=1 Tax=Capra hircus TaxID=9925 RepID=UPI0008464302|nr:PREDICTED: translation initiation factor IF-2-like [Capra hircus]
MPQVWPGAGAGPARGLPGAASTPPLLPSAGGAGREHKRLQLPSGRGPTPPTPGPGPARGEEAGRERQGGRERELERARAGPAGDPRRRGRVEGKGAGSVITGSRSGCLSCLLNISPVENSPKSMVQPPRSSRVASQSTRGP